MQVTPQHKCLVAAAWKELGEWRKFLIGIDGRDGSGKSTLARFLAWQMGMPAVETDLLLNPKQHGRIYREDDLRRLIQTRFGDKRPVIVEGVFLLKILENLKVKPDYFIFVENQSFKGSSTWQIEFAEYEKEYIPKEKADFVFSWKEN